MKSGDTNLFEQQTTTNTNNKAEELATNSTNNQVQSYKIERHLIDQRRSRRQQAKCEPGFDCLNCDWNRRGQLKALYLILKLLFLMLLFTCVTCWMWYLMFWMLLSYVFSVYVFVTIAFLFMLVIRCNLRDSHCLILLNEKGIIRKTNRMSKFAYFR